MLTFEAKKGDFAKIWQKLGDYSPPAPPQLCRPWGNILSCIPLCREQFDHASKDFLSQLGELGYEHFLRCIKNTDDEQNDVQKWWAMFGWYWLVLNRHNDDDI